MTIAPTDDSPAQRTARWRDCGFLALVMVIGSGLTLLAGTSLQQTEALRFKERQTAGIQAVAGALELEFTRTVQAMQDAKLMLESHPAITREAYNRYMQQLLQSQLNVNLVEWQPIVPANQLRQFEASARLSGLKNFRVVEPDSSGKGWQPAHGREKYVPVLFAWPEEYLTAGLDMGFSPERMESKLRSRALGKPVASGAFDFMKHAMVNSGTKAIAISTTVFDNNELPRGYLAAVVDLPTLFEKATRLAEAGGFDCLVYLSATPSAAPIYTWYGSDSDLKHLTAAQQAQATSNDPKATTELAQQAITVVLHPRPAFFAALPRTASHIAYASGIGLTALLLAVVAVYLRLNSRLRKEVSLHAGAETALRRSRELLERTGALAHVGGWEVDLANMKLSWTLETFRIAELEPPQEPALEEGINLFAPEARPVISAAVQAAIDTGTPYDLELPIVGAKGRAGWVRTQGFVEMRDGKAIRLYGTFQDITERKRKDAALHHLKTMMERSEAMAHLASFEWEVDTNTVTWSAEMFRIFGRDPALGIPNLEGQADLYTPESVKVLFDAVGKAVSDGTPYELELMAVRPNGERRPCLVKGFPERNASGRVVRLAGLVQDITERKEHDRRLEHIAHFDSLTNLPNRVLLADRLQQAMAQDQRRVQRLAVVFLDLDNFKAINDHHGHAIGDQVLITLARRMNEVLRDGDTMARIGGDEFVAVLIDLESVAASLPLLTRLIDAAAMPLHVGELTLQVSASLGVTFYPQARDINADQLLRQADQAMYQAKLAGKNRYHVFDAALDNSMRVHHESLERIRVALGQGEFVLHYQPKVNMGSGQIIGAEALIRWQHPKKGLLAPAAFLPVIEDHLLAVEVGEWVIDTALAQIAAWRTAGLNMPVSVNIGARQLQQGDFIQRLQSILARHPQVSPNSLELEVLETSALADMELVSTVIEDCAHIGVKFALDDFGTGYSSLTYLKRLRVALLKIDRSFVRDMLDDPDDMAILQGVIGLAAAFKCGVIAEGVETSAHCAALLKMGCELAQGFGIARPMPGHQMPAWAANWPGNNRSAAATAIAVE